MTNNNYRTTATSPSIPSSLLVTVGTYCIGGAALFVIGLWTGRVLSGERSKLLFHDETDEQQKQDSDDDSCNLPAPRRFGSVIQLKPDMYRRYRELHDNVWPDIIQRMYDSNIRNFVIYYHPETNTLYQHYEWIGHHRRYQQNPKKKDTEQSQERNEDKLQNNQSSLSLSSSTTIQLLPRTISTVQNIEIDWYNEDMEAILNDPITRVWWKECEPCQLPFTVGWEQQTLPSDGGTVQWWTPIECVCHIDTWPITYSTPWNKIDPDFIKLE